MSGALERLPTMAGAFFLTTIRQAWLGCKTTCGVWLTFRRFSGFAGSFHSLGPAYEPIMLCGRLALLAACE